MLSGSIEVGSEIYGCVGEHTMLQMLRRGWRCTIHPEYVL